MSVLKHLRSSTADKRPVASGVADGQLAINTASGTPGLYIRDNASGIVKIGPAHVGGTAPNAVPAGSSGNSRGELWVDTSTTTAGLKYFNGSAFVNLTPSGTTTTVGLVELATAAETQAGTDAVRAVTPSGLQSKVSDSTSTTSSTTIASATAVKTAYDLANAALSRSGGTVSGELLIGPSGSLVFEGSSDDSFETTLAVVNPTADRTITFPNTTGTVITTGDSGTVTSAMIADGAIVDADISNSAEIAVSKLADGSARQLLQTDAAGTGVEWTSNVDIPGTLDVTGTATFDGIISCLSELRLSSDQIIRWGTSDSSTISGRQGPGGNLIFGVNGERARIDSSGRLLIGTSSAISTNSVTAGVEVHSTSTTNGASLSIARFNNDSSGGQLILAKSRSATVAAGTIIQNNDDLGQLVFNGDDGTDLNTPAARIQCFVDGTPGANDMPGRLVFSTTADGGSSPTERMRITSGGNVGIGNPPTVSNLLHLRRDDSNNVDHLYIQNRNGGANSGARIAFSNSTNDYSDNRNAYIGAINTGASENGNHLVFGTNSNGGAPTEKLRIDSSGRLLIGTSTARANYFNSTTTSAVNIEGAGNDTRFLSIVASRSAQLGGGIILASQKSGAVGGNTIVESGGELGLISFQGNDGTEFVEAARLEAEVDGTPGANDMPGRLVFSTTADGASSPTEALRITNDQVIAYNQAAPVSKSTAVTLTIEELKNGIIQYTGNAQTLTLPTGTSSEGGFSGLYNNMTFEWSVINTGSGTCTVAGNTGHTVVGAGAVAAGSSGRFASRRTGANTFVTYRLS